MADADELAHLVDYLPDLPTLFACYDQQYFDGILSHDTFVEWSDRMTQCAGICYFRSTARYKISSQITTLKDNLGVFNEEKQRRCRIALSRPLLQLRPFKDTISTLLHEMIHAYLFIRSNGACRDREGHGTDFLLHMHRINAHSGAAITVRHGWSQEVWYWRSKHVWRCNGKCREWPPYYGWCRRSINRPPQPADWWWSRHQRDCGGTYIKVVNEKKEENIEDADKDEDDVIMVSFNKASAAPSSSASIIQLD